MVDYRSSYSAEEEQNEVNLGVGDLEVEGSAEAVALSDGECSELHSQFLSTKVFPTERLRNISAMIAPDRPLEERLRCVRLIRKLLSMEAN
ncbi:MAG: hypothetical protein MHM6MM_006483, partial [Cercozoa sp. M6MM]